MPEPATPYSLQCRTLNWGRGSDCSAQSAAHSPVDVKIKMHKKWAIVRIAPKPERETALKDKVKTMIDRDSAWCLLTEFTQSESLRKHALAVEACMRSCARKFGDGICLTAEDLWGIVGLIHDFDYERWPSLEDHPYKGNEILKERG